MLKIVLKEYAFVYNEYVFVRCRTLDRKGVFLGFPDPMSPLKNKFTRLGKKRVSLHLDFKVPVAERQPPIAYQYEQ